MSNENETWRKLREKVKARRNKCGQQKDVPPRTMKADELTVQRLSSEVSGKVQKYSRVGPREFVPFSTDKTMQHKLTIENIAKACERHFLPQVGPDLVCDVLAGDQGPSCKAVEQIPDLKVIYVRFIPKSMTAVDVPDSSSPNNQPNTTAGRKGRDRVQSDDVHTKVTVSACPKPKVAKCSGYGKTCFPRSLSVTEMINLGKLKQARATTVIKVYRFDMDFLFWSNIPIIVEFFEEKEPFGEGGFRKAFKATTKHPDFAERTWVIKRYLSTAIEAIEETGHTIKEHTQKVVQMHMLARNFASQLAEKVEKDQLSTFGEVMVYNEIFYGETDKGEHITVEEFMTGSFIKYLNNTGARCIEELNVMGQKAECLTHFSYEKSGRRLMLVDVQGIGYKLFDPEIASFDLYDDSNKFLYCTGNLSTMAIETFISSHKCNTYCHLIGLSTIEIA